MIRSQDRSGWIGASDTHYVMGNWQTRSFDNWWLEKLGLHKNDFSNIYTRAGTEYEHKILDALGFPLRKDYQIKIPRLRLRVNLDGDTPETVYEVKTHRADRPFKVSRQYYGQVQVEMYAKRCAYCYIVSYGLMDEEYRNYFLSVDTARIRLHYIAYDEAYIAAYLPRLKYLAQCLKEKRWPDGAEI